MKRGKIFLSDGDFIEAERYFEQALRQDPENSQAYLGKLMAELRVRDINELSSVPCQLSEHKLFKRALDFAGDDERVVLQKCLEANNECLKEEKYSEAVNLGIQVNNRIGDIDGLNRVAEIFEGLGNYKDSQSLAEQFREQANEEIKNKIGVNKIIICVLVLAIIIVSAIIFSR